VALQAGYEDLAHELRDRLKSGLGDSLVSVAIFGSVVRGEARPSSDLDVLIVVRRLPPGVTARLELVDDAQGPVEAKLRSRYSDAVVAPVLRTPEEVERGGPLYWDMTVGDVEILHDADGFLAGFLARLRTKMQACGARRTELRGTRCWDLKPDYQLGDIIDL
jgi:hypothetical protein